MSNKFKPDYEDGNVGFDYNSNKQPRRNVPEFDEWEATQKDFRKGKEGRAARRAKASRDRRRDDYDDDDGWN